MFRVENPPSSAYSVPAWCCHTTPLPHNSTAAHTYCHTPILPHTFTGACRPQHRCRHVHTYGAGGAQHQACPRYDCRTGEHAGVCVHDCVFGEVGSGEGPFHVQSTLSNGVSGSTMHYCNKYGLVESASCRFNQSICCSSSWLILILHSTM